MTNYLLVAPVLQLICWYYVIIYWFPKYVIRKAFSCLPCSCSCGSFSYIWHWCSLVSCCWATFCVLYLNTDHQMISSMINFEMRCIPEHNFSITVPLCFNTGSFDIDYLEGIRHVFPILFVFDKTFFPEMEIILLRFFLRKTLSISSFSYRRTPSYYLPCCFLTDVANLLVIRIQSSSFFQTSFHMEIVQLLCEVLLYLPSFFSLLLLCNLLWAPLQLLLLSLFASCSFLFLHLLEDV